MRKRGFTLVELMIVVAIIAVIVSIAIPGLLQANRASNERNASTSLKTLASAQADFRANDRNGNKVLDYWTLDVAGLYTVYNWVDMGNTAREPVALIEPSVAGADANPLPGAAPANYGLITDFVPTQTYKAGYWYLALEQDLSNPTGAITYRQNTLGIDGSGGTETAVAYNFWKFGYVTFPESLATGKWVFILNEQKTIYRQGLATEVRDLNNTVPAGLPIDPPGQGQINNWPTYVQLKAYWQKMD